MLKWKNIVLEDYKNSSGKIQNIIKDVSKCTSAS